MKEKYGAFLGLALLGLLLVSQVRIQTLEEKINLPKGERVRIVVYRKPWSSYGNEILIESPYGQTRKKFTGKKALNIWKLCQGDLEGDGDPEIGLGVYKKSPHHQVMARRPFFYSLDEGNLKPKFRASRLSLPMEDFILYDIDKDGREEVVSIERRDDQYFLAGYHYLNFHLSRDYFSRPLEEKPEFKEADLGSVLYKGRAWSLKCRGKEIVLL